MTLWRFDLDWDGMSLRGVRLHGGGGPMGGQWTPAAILKHIRGAARIFGDLIVWVEWSAAGGCALHVPAAEVSVLAMRLEAAS